MTTTLKLGYTGDSGRKALRDIEDAVLHGVGTGELTLEIDGQPVVVKDAEHSHGRSEFHPHDAKHDKHHPHASRQHDAHVSVTFVPKP